MSVTLCPPVSFSERSWSWMPLILPVAGCWSAWRGQHLTPSAAHRAALHNLHFLHFIHSLSTCQDSLFIGEESVAAGESCVLTDSPTWIVDPIDGTTNFVHRFPFVAVSIGFSINKQVEFGVVYSICEDKMYTARRGRGAFCNGEPLQVSEQTDIHQSLIATEFGSCRDPETVDKIFCSLRNIQHIPVHGVRGAGTAAINMCHVASGCVEAYYEIGMHVWDVAAGSLIVSEAGGVLMDVEGGEVDLMSRRIVAANNKTIAERIIKEISAYSPQRDDASPEKQ